ncbi:MAG TPA: hypothetical protein VN151_08360 [Terracidiphilus sp.]|nr:hypothetical protein [Terracidiphilus sp.]
MKKFLFSLMLTCAFSVTIVCLARALPLQDSPAASLSTPPSPDQVVAIMDKKMSLSDDQKDKLTPIIANRQQQLKALRDDQSMRRFQKLRAAKKVVGDSDKQINSILTPSQQKIYAEMEQQMRDQMKDRMQSTN